MNRHSIVYELERLGISVRNNGDVMFRGELTNFGAIKELLLNRIDKNADLLISFSNELYNALKSPISGESSPKTRKQFVHAIKELYNLFLDCKCPMHKIKAIKQIINSDSGLFSERFMSQIADYHLSVVWTMHLMDRDEYAYKMIEAYEIYGANKKVSTASYSSTPGYYSNLSLPMEERVWSIGDTWSEDMSRMRDKQMQSRYTMWSDSYNDTSIGEGFKWIDQSLSPFDGDDMETDSPYKSRAVLMNDSAAWRRR